MDWWMNRFMNHLLITLNAARRALWSPLFCSLARWRSCQAERDKHWLRAALWIRCWWQLRPARSAIRISSFPVLRCGVQTATWSKFKIIVIHSRIRTSTIEPGNNLCISVFCFKVFTYYMCLWNFTDFARRLIIQRRLERVVDSGNAAFLRRRSIS